MSEHLRHQYVVDSVETSVQIGLDGFIVQLIDELVEGIAVGHARRNARAVPSVSQDLQRVLLEFEAGDA